MTKTLLAFLFSLELVACGGAIASDGPAGPSADAGSSRGSMCVPATLESCSCDGGTGVSVCRADRKREVCGCGAPRQSAPSVGSELDRIRAGIVGTWTGTSQNPWDPQTDVVITFNANGTFTDYCTGAYCNVFHYDRTGPSPYEVYRLTSAGPDGAAGEITLPSAFRGELRRVQLTADGQHLSFEFWTISQPTGYGPVIVRLTRVG